MNYHVEVSFVIDAELIEAPLEKLGAQITRKIRAQVRRAPALCTHPEAEDVLRDDIGTVIGTVYVMTEAEFDRRNDPRIFITTKGVHVCQDCLTIEDRADKDAYVWYEGSTGWSSPVVRDRCKYSIPVFVDGEVCGESEDAS